VWQETQYWSRRDRFREGDWTLAWRATTGTPVRPTPASAIVPSEAASRVITPAPPAKDVLAYAYDCQLTRIGRCGLRTLYLYAFRRIQPYRMLLRSAPMAAYRSLNLDMLSAWNPGNSMMVFSSLDMRLS